MSLGKLPDGVQGVLEFPVWRLQKVEDVEPCRRLPSKNDGVRLTATTCPANSSDDSNDRVISP